MTSQMIEWKCPYCYTIYEIESKFVEALKDKKNCKFCVRKDPNIPTTAEMDGLLTQEDMRERHTMVMQCSKCNKWTKHKDYLINRKSLPCSNCGEIAYDSSSMKSARAYDPIKDAKRKPQQKGKKKR
jgi:phage FluMu protein Com